MPFTKEQLDNIDPVKAKHLLATIAANVDNNRLTDEAFRSFVRNSVPVVFGSNETKPQGQFDDYSGGQYR